MKLVINAGRSVDVIAREFGIGEQPLRLWVKLFKSRQDDSGGPSSEPERAELLRLSKENLDLKMDRAFLK